MIWNIKSSKKALEIKISVFSHISPRYFAFKYVLLREDVLG